MTHPIFIKAPGKIILSGEHSVVYGCPALASTIDRYATVESSFCSSGLTLHLDDFSTSVSFEWTEAVDLYRKIKDRHQRYCGGEIAISEVASSPESLLIFAIMELFDDDFPTRGINVRVSSDIPVGAGMGSSAAITAALLTSVSTLCNKPLTKDELYGLTHQTEHIQHGRSSGLDPAVVTQGGLLLWESEKAIQQQAPKNGSWYLLNSGKPLSTTGECVDRVRSTHINSGIWREFSEVTQQLSAAMQKQNSAEITTAIRDNHQLLIQIGVVPVAVQFYISTLESLGFAAKITGAGSVKGETAGMVLIYSPSGQKPPAYNDIEPELLSFQQHQIHECENR